MKPILLLLVHLASSALCFGQESTSKLDTNAVLEVLKLANQYNKSGKKKLAEQNYIRAGKLAEEIKFDNGFFKYSGEYTNFLYKELRYQEGIKIATQQLEKSKKTGNVNAEANAYNNLALFHYSMSNMTVAADYYIKALALSQKTNDLFNQRKYLTNLASLFIDIKNYEKGYYYANNGYNIAKQLSDSLSIAYSLSNLIVVEVHLNKLDQAQFHCEEMIFLAQKNNYKEVLATGYINLGEIYNKRNDYTASINILKKAEKLLPEIPAGYDVYIYHGLANGFKSLKNFETASCYFEKSKLNAEGLLPLNDLKDFYLLGAELMEETNDYKKAIVYRKKYQAVSDSLTHQTNHQNIQEIETKYQTSVREQKIAEQNLQIANHEKDLNRKNNFILIITLLLLILIASVFIITIFHKNRIKTHKLKHSKGVLEALLKGEERERTRTAKELHDGVASTLSAAKIHLNHLDTDQKLIQDNKEKISDLIDIALHEVRNISHNMSPNILLDEGLAYAIENFCNKVSTDQLLINSYCFGQLPKLHIEFELLIYRIVQEAVNNIIKHAKATEAIVQITANEECLDITIEDDGIGFDVQNIKGSGIGLSNMINRIQLLGGSYEIKSAIGEGANIYISIPLVKKASPLITDLAMTE